MQQPWPSYVLERCIFVRLQNPSARHPTSWSLKEMFHSFMKQHQSTSLLPNHWLYILQSFEPSTGRCNKQEDGKLRRGDGAFNSVFESTSSTGVHLQTIHACSPFLTEHFKEEGGVPGVPLHVLEIQEVLSPLGHRPLKREIISIQICKKLFMDFSSNLGTHLSSGIWANSWLYFSGTLGWQVWQCSSRIWWTCSLASCKCCLLLFRTAPALSKRMNFKQT